MKRSIGLVFVIGLVSVLLRFGVCGWFCLRSIPCFQSWFLLIVVVTNLNDLILYMKCFPHSPGSNSMSRSQKYLGWGRCWGGRHWKMRSSDSEVTPIFNHFNLLSFFPPFEIHPFVQTSRNVRMLIFPIFSPPCWQFCTIFVVICDCESGKILILIDTCLINVSESLSILASAATRTPNWLGPLHPPSLHFPSAIAVDSLVFWNPSERLETRALTLTWSPV